jgi:hypothetical protein
MASTGTIDSQSTHVTIAKTKTLINERLKAILRAEGLPVSGAKATMQGRIIDRTLLRTFLPSASPKSHVCSQPACSSLNTEGWGSVFGYSSLMSCLQPIGINNHARNGDVAGFNRMRDLVNNITQSSPSPHNQSGPATPPQNNVTVGSLRPSNPYPQTMASTTYPHGMHFDLARPPAIITNDSSSSSAIQRKPILHDHRAIDTGFGMQRYRLSQVFPKAFYSLPFTHSLSVL